MKTVKLNAFNNPFVYGVDNKEYLVFNIDNETQTLKFQSLIGDLKVKTANILFKANSLPAKLYEMVVEDDILTFTLPSVLTGYNSSMYVYLLLNYSDDLSTSDLYTFKLVDKGSSTFNFEISSICESNISTIVSEEIKNEGIAKSILDTVSNYEFDKLQHAQQSLSLVENAFASTLEKRIDLFNSAYDKANATKSNTTGDINDSDIDIPSSNTDSDLKNYVEIVKKQMAERLKNVTTVSEQIQHEMTQEKQSFLGASLIFQQDLKQERDIMSAYGESTRQHMDQEFNEVKNFANKVFVDFSNYIPDLDTSIKQLNDKIDATDIKVEKILADGKQEIDQKIAESETQIDAKLKDTNDKITKVDQKVTEYDQYFASGKSDWEEFVNQNREIIESVDPGGTILNELIDSRVDSSGTSHGSLNERIEKDVSDIKNEISDVSKTGGLENEELSDVALFTFFSHQNNFGKLYLSKDGINMTNTAVNFGKILRDPSIIFCDGYFYIAHTKYDPQDFKMECSKNLVDWETIDVSLGLLNSTAEAYRVWAPELVILDKEVYVVVSIRVGETLDENGDTIGSFRPYIAKAIDLKAGVFGAPREILLPDLDDHQNRIDGTIVKKDDSYYLFIKDEFDKKIEQWESTDLVTWSKVSDQVGDFGAYVEGPSVIEMNGEYRLYVDAYQMQETFVITSTDLINWSEKQNVIVDEPIRHGSGFVPDTPECRKILNSFAIAKETSLKRNIKRTLYFDSLARQSSADGKTIEEFCPIQDALYVLSNGYDITVNTTVNRFNSKRFYMMIQAGVSASIVFKKSSGITINYEASVDRDMNDCLIEFNLLDDSNSFFPSVPQGPTFSKGNHFKLVTANAKLKGLVKAWRNLQQVQIGFENVKFDLMTVGETIGTLSEEYRPEVMTQVRIPSDDQGADIFATIRIDTTGVMTLRRVGNVNSTYNGVQMYMAKN